METDPWHYSRAGLARRTCLALLTGPAKSLTLFAPRRTGKTEFLLKDLAPYAVKQGHRVVYASFWQAPLAPLAILIYQLESAVRGGSLDERRGTALTPKLKLPAPLPGSRLEAEIDLAGLRGEAPSDLLLYLDDLLARLEDSKRPLLLLLDEVQELARDPKNRSLIASLRTSLDVRSDGIRAVFTGSSLQDLKAMFSKREAPFFHFGTSLDLEPLGEPFVDHQIAVMESTTGRTIERTVALEAFDDLSRSPYFFRRLIEVLVLRPDLGIGDALEALRGEQAFKLGYADTWLGLTAIQRATTKALAEGAERPYSGATRERIGEMIDARAPSIDQVQTALRRLERLRIAAVWSGQWHIEDPEFARWIIHKAA